MSPRTELDVAVIGGGPAGLATAIGVRRRGLSVAVLERGTAPRDKACGEGLMPDAVAALGKLGVDAAALGAPFRGIRYRWPGGSAEGRFPGPPGIGVRRPRLHEALWRSAATAGVELRAETRVEGAEGTAGSGPIALRTTAGEVRARWLVGADGLRSAVRRWAGLAGPPARGQRFGVTRHFRLAPWTDLVEVHWGVGAEAYVTPLEVDEVGVALLWSSGKGSFDRLLGRFPELRSRLAGAPATSADRGAGPMHQRTREVATGRVALVGDAAGYLDPITGEGLALAFHQAAALAAALAAGDLGPYRAACRRQRRIPDLLTHALLVAERHPLLRDRLLAALADPRLFSDFLAVHAREAALSPRLVGRFAVALAGYRSAPPAA